MKLNESDLTEIMDSSTLAFQDILEDSEKIFSLKYKPICDLIAILKSASEEREINPDLDSLILKLQYAEDIYQSLNENVFSKSDSIIMSLKESMPYTSNQKGLSKDFSLLLSMINEDVEHLKGSSLVGIVSYTRMSISPAEVSAEILKDILKKAAKKKFMNTRKRELVEYLAL